MLLVLKVLKDEGKEIQLWKYKLKAKNKSVI